MRKIQHARTVRSQQGFLRLGTARQAAIIAAAALSIGSSALATTLYFDTNGATSGLGAGTGVWDEATTSDWNTATNNSTAPGLWTQGSTDFNTAVFDGSGVQTANVTGTVDVGGITFSANASNVINGSGTLNIGSNSVTISETISDGQNIVVPITGTSTSTLTISYTGTGTQGQDINVLGSLTGFNGTLVVSTDKTSPSGANYTQLAIGSDLGSGATIQLQAFSQLTTENATGNTVTGANQQPVFTLHAPILLNSTNASNSQEWIGAANGGNFNGGGITYASTSMQSIMTLAGVISGSTSALNLGYGVNGGRGTVVLDNNETYTGNTYINLAGTNGLVQMGVDNALPAATVLSFGPDLTNGTSTSSVAPLDLNGHVMTIAGLATTSTYTNTSASSQSAAQTSPIGNIYNTSSNAASIIIAGSTNTTYKGDIGDSNAAVNPFNDMYPYNGNTTANTNISLTINGPGVLTLAPQVETPSGTVTNFMTNEYSGNTTVNGGGLALGGTNVYAGFGNLPAQLSGTSSYYYTLSSTSNTVTVNSGATLSSTPTTFATGSSTYVGGAAGTIILNSGSTFAPGGAGTAGVFVTNNMTVNSGAAMNFDIVARDQYDWMIALGNFTLDNTGTHTVNINIPAGDAPTPGDYPLIYTGGINSTSGDGFVLGSVPTLANTSYQLINDGSTLVLQMFGQALQWDPTGGGINTGLYTLTESGGEWTDGSNGDPASQFFDYSNYTDRGWSNSVNETVIIGGDPTQNGGQIYLGSNITVNGQLIFGLIAPGNNYSIINQNGNTYALTLGGGIAVNNFASSGGSPSAEIDVPVILSASQTFEVDPSQKLVITGSLTENDGTPSYTLTKTGTGELDLDNLTGSIAALNVSAGTVLLGGVNSIGNAAVTLNGSSLEIASSGTFANSITINSGGANLGATATGSTVTFPSNISTTGPLAVTGPGSISFGGTLSSGTLTFSSSSSATAFTVAGNVTATGATTISSGGVTFNANFTGTTLTNNSAATSNFDGTTTLTGALTNSAGSLNFNGNLTGTTLTNSSAGTSNFTGTTTLSGALTTSAGRLNFNGNTTAASLTLTAGTIVLASTATDSFSSGLTLVAGTLVAGSSADLGVSVSKPAGNGITFAPTAATGATLNLNGVTTLPNAINLGGTSTTQDGDTITTFPFSGGTTSVPITLSGVITGDANITLLGSDFTLSGANTYGPPSGVGTAGGALTVGNTGTYAGQAMTIHASNAKSFGTGTITASAPVTLDIQTAVTASNLKGNALYTKIGTGTLNLNGMASSGPGGNQLGYLIQTGAIEVSNINALGGLEATAIAAATSPSMGTITIDPSASLIANTNGSDYTGTITLAGGGISRTSLASNTSDFVLTTYFTDTGGSKTADTHNAVMNVTSSSTIENQDQSTYSATHADSHNLTVQMPVTVDTGATLTLKADNTAGNFEQAATVLNGVSNNSSYPYQNLTLQAGSSLTTTGTGDVDLGSTAAGDPIIAQGTPGSDATMYLDSHTFLTDSGAATQNQGASDMTRLVVDGTGTAGLRIEAPMDAIYTVPNGSAPNLRTYDGFTGLTGVNMTATASAGTTPTGYTTIGNGFTVLSPNRAAALSNSYTLPGTGGTITPGGTLTLAAVDPRGATGLINAGPASPASVALALDSGTGSGGTLTYQIDPGGNGATFGNFAGLTVERTYTSANVVAQLLGTTKVPSLTITGGAKVDITNQALVVDPATGPAPTSQIAGYLASAYDSGAWDLGGIGSSSVSGLNGTSIGYVENDALATPYTNFGGQSVDNNAVLVKYTWLGDLNLDGKVDSSDLAMMGKVPTSGPEAGVIGWFDGDLNYDGKINADDWSLFFLGDAAQTGTLTSAVPEPAMGTMLVLGALSLAGRRRRR